MRLVVPTVLGAFVSIAFSPLLVHCRNNKAPLEKSFYRPGDLLDISCLNRTTDTGEHIQDSHGTLQYIPFPLCNETTLPLTLTFLSETPLNCTIPLLTDELYHLLEFYVHADSPLTCRIPRRPLTGERDLSPSSSSSTSQTSFGADSGDGIEWIPLVFSLAGKIERSHLHIANHMNVIVHVSPDDEGAGSRDKLVVESATAYSVSTGKEDSQTQVIIGDPLPLFMNVRWYAGNTLPRGTYGKGKSAVLKSFGGKGGAGGEHVTIHTVIYCVLSCVATAAVCAVYFRGWEFPKRLRRYDFDRRGGGGGMFGTGASDFGVSSGGRVGYGYGVGGFGAGVSGSAYSKKD